MDILIDTNVLIDHLQPNPSEAANAAKILQFCRDKHCNGYMAAHSITNSFYILRKFYSETDRKKMLLALCNLIEVVDLRKDFIKNALNDAAFSDFEDRLQYECAQDVHADYIITRNISDFTNSTITAISPADFITLMVNQEQKIKN